MGNYSNESLILPILLSKYRTNSSSVPKALSIFNLLVRQIKPDTLEPHKFVSEMMNLFEKQYPQVDRSIHGRLFEYVIGESLAQQGIRFLYYQAEVLHIPLATFDWLLYHPVTPVSISCKTKARDRWKQAAYEAMALKRVYTQAENYLVTIEPLSRTATKKQQAPDIIDEYLIATEPNYSEAISKISQIEFVEAVSRSPIVSGDLLRVS